MQFVRRKRRSPVINIISMIDILVVLLIFYIVTTVFKKPQPVVNIAVPSSTQATTTQDLRPEILYYTADQKLFLNSQPIKLGDLAQTWKEKLRQNSQYKVDLKADVDLHMGEYVKIIDAAHEAGIEDLPMFVQKTGSGGPADGGTNP